MIDPLAQMVLRMRTDVRLATVTLYCVCAVALITPFAFFRFYVGDVLVALADLAIVCVFLATTRLTWIPGRTQLGADLTATSATLAVLTVVYLLDISHLRTFSTLVGNFVMARVSVALLLSSILITGVAINAAGFQSTTEQYTFLTVAAMVSLFSMIFASRVENQHVFLSALASRDGLTGAFNRRTMDSDLKRVIDNRADESPGHCLALIDLDNFKALNDSQGHAVGDEILSRLTNIIVANTREKDRFYRL